MWGDTKQHAIAWSVQVVLVVVFGVIGLGFAQQLTIEGTLRVAWEADITGLDPYISPGVQSWHVVGNLFNSLLPIDTELNYVAGLAEF